MLLRQNKVEQALASLQEAARRRPDQGQIRYQLGVALLRKGDPAGAVRQAQLALATWPRELAPGRWRVHKLLGIAYYEGGEYERAITHLSRAAAGSREDHQALEYLALAHRRLGQASEAIVALRRALAIRPDAPSVLTKLAWILATQPDERHRDGAEAVRLATRACTLTQETEPRALAALAAALAEVGQFDRSVEKAEQAVSIARAVGNAALTKPFKAQLECYRRRQPWRESGTTRPAETQLGTPPRR